MIAFLGMGLLGSNFVRALRKRGDDVQVWNRTPDKAKALEADGARAFADAADAVRGASIIHLTLLDDAVVDAVLELARPVAGQIIVDHTTTSAAGVLVRIARWRERGVTYLHAPVFMGPQNARESTGIMMVSGARDAVEPRKAELAKMTGKLVDLGDRPDAAAAYKLMGNLFLMAFTVGLADVLALGKTLGVPAADIAKLFEAFNPAASIGPRLKRMADGAFLEPSWELAMARKDARLMHETGTQFALLPGIIARMDDFIARGHGAHDWTVIASDSV